MHVAYIHQHFSTRQGATGTRSYEMAQRLLQAGHRVTMICGQYAAGDGANSSGGGAKSVTGTESGGDGVEDREIDGIRVLRIREPYAHQMGFQRRLWSFGRFAQKAGRILRSLHPDLVFATSTPLTVGIPGMRAARRLRIPFVFEVRDLWPELPIALGVLRNPVLRSLARWLERTIYRSARRIIALAPGIRAGIARTGYAEERIDVLPNCCDTDLFVPTDERLRNDRFGPVDACRFVFTGAHGLANGLDAVLDAAAELKRRGEHGIRFVFIGDGKEKPRLVRRSQDEGLSEWVIWVDPMPKVELASVLPRMDVGLMVLKNCPAFYQGTSPNKFFDFIAAGIPVLGNYPGWIADLIREHECGDVVPPDDPRSFADAVVRLRDAKANRKAMGRRGRVLAETQFSRDEIGRRFVAVVERAYEEFGADSSSSSHG